MVLEQAVCTVLYSTAQSHMDLHSAGHSPPSKLQLHTDQPIVNANPVRAFDLSSETGSVKSRSSYLQFWSFKYAQM